MTTYIHDPLSRPPPLQSSFWVQWWQHATPGQVAAFDSRNQWICALACLIMLPAYTLALASLAGLLT